MLPLDTALELNRPHTVRFGSDTLSTLPAWVQDQGYRRPFVVADPVNAARVGLLGIDAAAVFGEVRGEPDLRMLEAALAQVADADVLIGFGGGSAMDLAKLVAVLAASDLTLDDISGPGRAPKRKLGLVQVPTTAGTGSEVGTRALITDPTTHAKIATESPHLLADLAIIDPTLTVSVPAPITATTGIDALAHCVEAFTSKRAHPVIDAYAMEGIKLVGAYLHRAVADGTDLEARAGLALASFYGGICLGPVNTTAGHAVAYPLGTRFGLPHGLANTLIFPHTLAVNAPATPEKTLSICTALGQPVSDIAQVRRVARHYCESLGVDMTLSAHGVPDDAFGSLAKDAHAIRRLLDWNPVDLTQDDIRKIYEAAENAA
ncbi:MAG: iron-containing alcohol dehydrogenase [Rhodobacteraceae bacterium]|nr:iron-containing alcohol dehydrogenase [Paracoccaceae bacterium]